MGVRSQRFSARRGATRRRRVHRGRIGVGLRTMVLWVVAAAACALSLSALLPMHFAILGTSGVVLAAVAFLHRNAAREHAELVARVEAIKGVRAGGVRLGLWSDPWRRTRAVTRTL